MHHQLIKFESPQRSELGIIDLLLLDSHMNKTDDRNENKSYNINEDTMIQAPTSAQKWWTALLLGMLFGIISSSFLYGITNYCSKKTIGFKTYDSCGGATLIGLLIHTVIFILIIRLILG